jgi:hypothetical protein
MIHAGELGSEGAMMSIVVRAQCAGLPLILTNKKCSALCFCGVEALAPSEFNDW